MKRYCIIEAALAYLLLLHSPVNAAEIDITLKNIVEAPRQNDYQGVLTTQTYTDQAEPIRNTQRIIHQQPDRNRMVRLESDTPGDLTVIQINDDIYSRESVAGSIYYTHRRISGESGLGLGLGFSSLDLLRTNYELIERGREIVLDRNAVVLSLQPNHPGRISKTAWVDEVTGLVLRTEDRDEYGNILEEMFFTEISVAPSVDESLFATDEWTDRAVEENQVIACGTLQEVEEVAGFPLAAPVYMPAGFTLDRLRVILYANQPTAHFTYTDGLAQISLYQREAAPSDSAAMAWPGGTPHVQGNVQVWNMGTLSHILRSSDDTRLFTVVSDITEDESIDMIRSICVINPPDTNSHSSSVDFLWFAGGGLMVGSLVFGGWFLRRRI